MKTLLLMTVLLLPCITMGGTCQTMLSSEETGKLMFHDGIYTRHEGDFTFEECVNLAMSKLGSIKHMKTLIRDDYRYITEVNYKFSNERFTSKASLTLKNLTRP
jgi:hypothetical protein